MKTRNFRVITITNNLNKYPQYYEDTQEYSDLLNLMDEDVGSFVVNLDTRKAYPATFMHKYGKHEYYYTLIPLEEQDCLYYKVCIKE